MTVTILNLPPPPEGYGPECHYGALPDGEIVVYFGGGHWGLQPQFEGGTGIYARPVKPWYPPSWYGPDGKLLPDVYEHTPGDWPKHARPGDEIDHMARGERICRDHHPTQMRGDEVSWRTGRPGHKDHEDIAAYRVISRVQS